MQGVRSTEVIDGQRLDYLTALRYAVNEEAADEKPQLLCIRYKMPDTKIISEQ